MTGRQITAWLTVPDAVVAHYVHPDLRPPVADAHQSRLRFYEMEANGERFHELVTSLPMRAGGVDGEATLVLWSDSENYRTWAREEFGWPALDARFEYEGSLWETGPPEGATGSARARMSEGTIALTVETPARAAEPVSGWMVRKPWLAPRRIVHRGGLDGETREVMDVKPSIRRPGTRLVAQGRARFDLGPGNPYTALGEVVCEVEVLDGFELVVGDTVELVCSEHVAAPVR